MDIAAFDKKLFISRLFSWFRANKRDLPWRRTYSPYHVWISEMMLQQTQMERGVQYFNRWMQEFKTPRDVADAPLEKILQLWEGLGYYSRAKNIYAAAQIIRDEYNGEIPCDADKLRVLPGIGEYTLCALMGIAFEQDFATIDANVERVFARILDCTETNLKKALRPYVQKLLPAGQARTYNQALMELGALVCKKNPRCDICPLTEFCLGKIRNVQHERPVPKEKKESIPVLAAFCIAENTKGEELIRQRTGQKLWNSMWEYIGIDEIILDSGGTGTLPVQETDKAELTKQALLAELEKQLGLGRNEILPLLSPVPVRTRGTYTNHRLTAYFFRLRLTEQAEKKLRLASGLVWTDNTEKVAMPSHHRKAHAQKQKGQLLALLHEK